MWYFILHLILSSDIHPNSGPIHSSNSFSGGFLSFCNWNLTTLSKDDIYRISLIMTLFPSAKQVPVNILPGYKFHACNHPGGKRSGGVGFCYKETLRMRRDLMLEECIVSELIFGHKKIFFTVMYRNPENKVSSTEFQHFIGCVENLYLKIKGRNP